MFEDLCTSFKNGKMEQQQKMGEIIERENVYKLFKYCCEFRF